MAIATLHFCRIHSTISFFLITPSVAVSYSPRVSGRYIGITSVSHKLISKSSPRQKKQNPASSPRKYIFISETISPLTCTWVLLLFFAPSRCSVLEGDYLLFPFFQYFTSIPSTKYRIVILLGFETVLLILKFLAYSIAFSTHIFSLALDITNVIVFLLSATASSPHISKFSGSKT